MATKTGAARFTVWRFDSVTGADDVLSRLERLQKEELVQIHDAAVVSWPPGKKKPSTRQLSNLAGAGALGGAFWGFLFGLIFFVPLLCLAVGAAAGALTGSMTDVGIDDDFIKEVRAKIQPGTSALFLMTSGGVQDKLEEEFADEKGHVELIHTNLSSEEESKLRQVFAEE
jgi:uncharacterized membrane protein